MSFPTKLWVPSTSISHTCSSGKRSIFTTLSQTAVLPSSDRTAMSAPSLISEAFVHSPSLAEALGLSSTRIALRLSTGVVDKKPRFVYIRGTIPEAETFVVSVSLFFSNRWRSEFRCINLEPNRALKSEAELFVVLTNRTDFFVSSRCLRTS